MFLWICQKAFGFRHVRSFACLLSSVYKDRKVLALSLSLSVVDNQLSSLLSTDSKGRVTDRNFFWDSCAQCEKHHRDNLGTYLPSSLILYQVSTVTMQMSWSAVSPSMPIGSSRRSCASNLTMYATPSACKRTMSVTRRTLPSCRPRVQTSTTTVVSSVSKGSGTFRASASWRKPAAVFGHHCPALGGGVEADIRGEKR
jgi:hypothetical protein